MSCSSIGTFTLKTVIAVNRKKFSLKEIYSMYRLLILKQLVLCCYIFGFHKNFFKRKRRKTTHLKLPKILHCAALR